MYFDKIRWHITKKYINMYVIRQQKFFANVIFIICISQSSVSKVHIRFRFTPRILMLVWFPFNLFPVYILYTWMLDCCSSSSGLWHQLAQQAHSPLKSNVRTKVMATSFLCHTTSIIYITLYDCSNDCIYTTNLTTCCLTL